MADNYLENRMADYRAGRLAPQHSRAVARHVPDDALVLRYPSLSVAVCAPRCTPLVEYTVGAFRSVGARVALLCPDAQPCTALAQRSGARYYPGNIIPQRAGRDILERWGKLDMTVSFDAAPVPDAPIRLSVDGLNELNPQSVARLILYASHPDNLPMLTAGVFSGLTLRKSAENP